jgi:hypothetical protein
LINSISCSTNDIQSTTRQSIAQKVAAEIEKIEKDLEEEENQLEKDRKKFEEEKQISKMINSTDVFIFNVGGEIMMTTRETLTRIPKSIFSLAFNGRWEHKLQRDKEGNIFLDFNPILFRHLLDQLQIIENNIHPPSEPSLVEPFKKMIRKLRLQQSLSSEKKNVITFNVDGQTITNQRTTLAQVSNSTFDTIVPPSIMINFNNPNDVFVDYDPKLFQHLINQLRKESFKSISSFGLLSEKEKISFETMLSDFNIFVVTTTTTTSTTTTTRRTITTTKSKSKSRKT